MTEVQSRSEPSSGVRAGVLLGALGVVFGDIGTSPLYAFRESLKAAGGGAAATEAAVYGILSLIFWALVVIVTLKYVLFVMRADNQGNPRLNFWQAPLYAFLTRNAVSAPEFYLIPTENVVELGTRVEL